uniref:enhancer of mRNA-decapping protein 4-like isoform X2 n=1 Tax=Styela clava TaxID=7725 RepID=UPI0019392734|nr:enhancer of mRNA-decapping protein 4-like isoform X2 [Styela clava]
MEEIIRKDPTHLPVQQLKDERQTTPNISSAHQEVLDLVKKELKSFEDRIYAEMSSLFQVYFEISDHVLKKNYDAAFRMALSKKKLELLIHVCKLVDPSKIFCNPSPYLQQSVILSLIRQLSCDLHHDTLLKFRYLIKAVAKLDFSREVTKERGKVVLKEVAETLKIHIATLDIRADAQIFIEASKLASAVKTVILVTSL